VQRFVEDESFKGPRLPNYINNRCVLRNLLQVPVIKGQRQDSETLQPTRPCLCIYCCF
jgi:hypothetical protein